MAHLIVLPKIEVVIHGSRRRQRFHYVTNDSAFATPPTTAPSLRHRRQSLHYVTDDSAFIMSHTKKSLLMADATEFNGDRLHHSETRYDAVVAQWPLLDC